MRQIFLLSFAPRHEDGGVFKSERFQKAIHRGSAGLWVVEPQQVGSFRDNRGTLLQKLRAALSTTSLLPAGDNRCEYKHPNLPIAADPECLGVAGTTHFRKA